MSDGKNIGPMALSYVQIKRHRNENKNFLCFKHLVYKGMASRRLECAQLNVDVIMMVVMDGGCEAIVAHSFGKF